MRWTRGLALASIATAVLVAAPNVASAYGYGYGNGSGPSHGWKYDYNDSTTLVNVAKEWNGTSGSFKGNLSLAVQRSTHARTRVINNVVASSNCFGCGTVVVGFQIALISHPTPEIYAENKAFAYNTYCGGCLTVGLAFQFVVATAAPLVLSSLAQSQLSQVASELDRLRTSKLPASTIDTLVSRQAETVRNILSSSAAAAKNPATVSVDRFADLTA